MSKLVPSPDWFVGVDSLNLCQDNTWVDSISEHLQPHDGGTDNGFTFTSPNWPTQPRGVIFQISSRYPTHPAGSFHYPHLDTLPTIATIHFKKVRIYYIRGLSFKCAILIHNLIAEGSRIQRIEKEEGKGN